MSKGEDTKSEILEEAYRLASIHGLSGLTIGELAKKVGMSKSGLFAHFNSKENLQLDVLSWTIEMFVANVLRPAIEAPRGVPRLSKFINSWRKWHKSLATPGGCVFISASTEFDDQPGAVRDLLKRSQNDLYQSLARIVKGAVEEGHFSPGTDPEQFAYELYSYFLAFHHFNRLLNDKNAEEKLEVAVEQLITNHLTNEGKNV